MTYFSVENLEMLDDESVEKRNDNDVADSKGADPSIFWDAIKGNHAVLCAASDLEIVNAATCKLSLAAEMLRKDASEGLETMAKLAVHMEGDADLDGQLRTLRERLDAVEGFCDKLILSVSQLSSDYAQCAEITSGVSSTLKRLNAARSKRMALAKKAS